MLFRHVILIIVIIALIFLLLYSNKFKRQIISKTTGGGADDIGKQIIGMFIGSLNNPILEYNNTSLSLTVKTQTKPTKKFNIYYGSLNKLSSIIIKDSKTIINVEFNESYRYEHRIKNLYTSLMLILTLIYNKYDYTDVNLFNNVSDIIMTKKRSTFSLKVGDRTEFTLKTGHKPFTLRIVNINYESTNDLINFLNTKEKQPFNIISKYVFSKLINIPSYLNPFYNNSIGSIGINSDFKEYTTTEQGIYGYIISENITKKSSQYVKKTSDKNYGFNYIDIDFKNTFKLDDDFDAVITNICKVNDVKKSFITEVINDLTKTVHKYSPITKDSSEHTYTSYEYFKKLKNILHTLSDSHNDNITYPGTKTAINGTTTLANIVKCTYEVNPNLLVFDA